MNFIQNAVWLFLVSGGSWLLRRHCEKLPSPTWLNTLTTAYKANCPEDIEGTVSLIVYADNETSASKWHDAITSASMVKY